MSLHLRSFTLISFDKLVENRKMLDEAKLMEELQKYDCLYGKFGRDFKDKSCAIRNT